MRRRALLSTVAATGLTVLAGCGADGDDGTDGQSPDAQATTDPESATTNPASTTDTPTPDDDPDGIDEMRNTPEANKSILLENYDDEAHTVTLTVTHDADETVVHEGTYELSPDGTRVPYNVREADPDGIEQFCIDATVDGGVDGSGTCFKTSRCYGSPTVTITEDGRLRLAYAIC